MDERLNNILAAGAVFGILMECWQKIKVDPMFDDNGDALNTLRVAIPFLKSPYIITIEREVANERSDHTSAPR